MNMQRSARTSPNWRRNTRLGLAGLAGTRWIRAVRLMMVTRGVPVALAVFFVISGAAAQVSSSQELDELKEKCGSQVRSTYLLGPDDLLQLSGPGLSDIPHQPARIDVNGDIHYPH